MCEKIETQTFDVGRRRHSLRTSNRTTGTFETAHTITSHRRHQRRRQSSNKTSHGSTTVISKNNNNNTTRVVVATTQSQNEGKLNSCMEQKFFSQFQCKINMREWRTRRTANKRKTNAEYKISHAEENKCLSLLPPVSIRVQCERAVVYKRNHRLLTLIYLSKILEKLKKFCEKCKKSKTNISTNVQMLR